MGKHKKALLVGYDVELVPEGGSQVYASLTALSKTYGKDAAGHIFHLVALKQAGLYDEPEEPEATDEESSVGTSRQDSTADFSTLEEEAAAGAKWRGKGKKRKGQKKKEEDDLYALLGLFNERWTASTDQIKTAYRKAALLHHPDKQNAAAGDDESAKVAAEERFKRIQEAYETLSDPARRREYDSTDDFDDSLPQECAPADFYKVFGPAFRRNSRWSTNQPVPDLGDDSLPIDKASADRQVDAFYDFWYTFRSWREFPHPDEEDIEQAESREHRRWIERYNTKLREKAKREETRRIRQFVEDAILRRKEAERQEKERKKAEKEAARLAAQQAEQRRIEEEAARKAAEEAAAAEARKQRQVEKKQLQKERARLRRLSGEGSLPGLDAESVELLCTSLGLEELQALNNLLADAAASAADKQAAVQRQLAVVQASQDAEQQAKEEASRQASEAAKQAEQAERQQRQARLREWDEEEVRMLRKALDKFPPGTSKRWEQVQGYVRTRTVEEVLDMVKHGLKAGKYVTPQQESFVVTKKRQANTVIRSAADSRDLAFTDVDVNLRGDAVKLVNGAVAGTSGSGESGQTVAVGGGNASDSAAGAGPGTQQRQQQAGGQQQQPQQPKVVASAASGEWTEQQELALVKAIKQVGKDVAGDRWEQIAALVPGKSKAQCFKRFKELKETFKAKKGGGGAE
ncbi:hypothetical protein N2152v2_009517 [Parachlorella kessleri]